MYQLQTGSSAPSLEGIEFVSGQPLLQIRPGTPYVIDFWATWCPPCRESLPHLSQLQKRYPGAAFLAISTERDGEVVRRYVQQHRQDMTFAVAYDPSGIAGGNWLRAAGRNTIPSTFVINTQGQIAWIGHPMNLDRGVSLKKLLGLAPPTKPSGRMRFVGLPSQWNPENGSLVVALSQDPHPRSTTIQTRIKLDGRVISESLSSPLTVSVTAAELSPGDHLFEAVRYDTLNGREFITDRARVHVGSGVMPSTGGLSAHQQNVVVLTNQQRSREGLPELRVSPALMKAAQDYATLMASLGHFSHTGPDGSGPKERAKQAGYESGYCGENIAMGQSTASAALRSWMQSQGHRENILRPQYQEIGVGHATGNRGHYWVQLFGASR